MSYAVWLVPVGLVMGLIGLLAFLWSMKSGQLEDLDGAAERVLLAETTDRPLAADVSQIRPAPPVAPGTQAQPTPVQHQSKD